MKYIDISTFQRTVDFESVKGNVDGVIIRAGYGAGNIDAQFRRNAGECNRLGIPCGAYWFSYALNPTMAKLEAQKFLAAVEPYRMELPLAFDFEYDSINYMRKNGVTPTKALCTAIAHAFCENVEAAGYYTMIYANRDFLTNWFENSVSRFDLWYAAWLSAVDVLHPPRKCGIWQWGGSAIPGIAGDVDSNEAYHDYAAIIRNAGLNRLPTPVEPPVEQPEPAEPTQPVEDTEEDAVKIPPDCEGYWGAENVARCIQLGLMKGYEDGTFRPQSSITRGEAATLLVRLYDLLEGTK